MEIVSPLSVAELSIVMIVSVTVCLCVSVREYISGTTSPIFNKIVCMLPMAVARPSFGGVAICYVIPVLCMPSYLHIR